MSAISQSQVYHEMQAQAMQIRSAKQQASGEFHELMEAITSKIKSGEVPELANLLIAFVRIKTYNGCLEDIEDFAQMICAPEVAFSLSGDEMASLMQSIVSGDSVTQEEQATLFEYMFQWFGSQIPKVFEHFAAQLQSVNQTLEQIAAAESSGKAFDPNLKEEAVREGARLMKQVQELLACVQYVSNEEVKGKLIEAAQSMLASSEQLMSYSLSKVAQVQKESVDVVVSPFSVSDHGNSLEGLMRYMQELQQCEESKRGVTQEFAALFDEVVSFFKNAGYTREQYQAIRESGEFPEEIHLKLARLKEIATSDVLGTQRALKGKLESAESELLKVSEAISRGDAQGFMDLLRFVNVTFSSHFLALDAMTRSFNAEVKLLKMVCISVPDLLQVPPCLENVEWLNQHFSKKAEDVARAAFKLGVASEPEQSKEEELVQTVASDIVRYRQLLEDLKGMHQNPNTDHIELFLQKLMISFDFDLMTNDPSKIGTYEEKFGKRFAYVLVEDADVFDRLLNTFLLFKEAASIRNLTQEEYQQELAGYIRSIQSLVDAAQIFLEKSSQAESGVAEAMEAADEKPSNKDAMDATEVTSVKAPFDMSSLKEILRDQAMLELTQALAASNIKERSI